MIEKGLQGYLEDTRNRGAGKGGGEKGYRILLVCVRDARRYETIVKIRGIQTIVGKSGGIVEKVSR